MRCVRPSMYPLCVCYRRRLTCAPPLCRPRQGRFAFTSVVGGEHVLCFSTNSSRWFGQPKKFVRRGPPCSAYSLCSCCCLSGPRRVAPPLTACAACWRPWLTRVRSCSVPSSRQRVDLTLSVGEMAVDYTEVAKKEHLTELEVEIRKLNDKLRDIMKEVEYQRKREEAFRNTSESTNSRVQWWSIAQVRGTLACGTCAPSPSRVHAPYPARVPVPVAADDRAGSVGCVANPPPAELLHRQEAPVARC